VDPLTARIVLKSPSAPFLSLLTDRAGMLVSPKAAEAAGKDFGTHPVCSGPFSFVERVAQDRIVLDRYSQYWDAKDIHVGRVIYRSMVDNSVRLTNLQAGALDIGERIAATDVAKAKQDDRLNVFVYPGLGYASLNFNVGNGPRADSPVGRSALVRKAFELSIDRAALVQVVYNGLFTPVAQAMSPANPFYNPDVKPTERNIAKAKELLKQAGVALPVVVNLTVTTLPDQRQTGEIIQSMASEAGFDVRVRSTEFGSALAAQTHGDFEISAIGWSGRIDPDGNMYNGLHSKGALNETHYANPQVDAWLDAARATNDFAARKALYAKITAKVHEDLPVMYLYNTALVVVTTKKVSGLRLVPDGLIRLQGLKLAE
jgi:peptide/nickel transport system substrate-binding protein